MIEYDEYGYPVATETGIRCGNHGRGQTIRHVSIEAVHQCFQATWADQAQQEAEIWAKGAWLRQAENAGYWEAQAERAWEDARGDAYRVVQFDQACPELFRCQGCQTPEGQVCPESCPERQAEEAQERYANAY
jgi:hypothetical protein